MNRYEEAAKVLMRLTGVEVRKYRKSNTGTAYIKATDWGIECPRPRGPISFAVFAHEVGHQVLHRHGKRPRWVEEVEAWDYALARLDELEPTDAARTRVRRTAEKSIAYAFVKARRRGVTVETIHERFPEWYEAILNREWRFDEEDIDRSGVEFLDA